MILAAVIAASPSPQTGISPRHRGLDPDEADSAGNVTEGPDIIRYEDSYARVQSIANSPGKDCYLLGAAQ